ncbi:MAG: acetyl-CoA C-acyltransferase, partial [Labilithrix sp.]|nr:acetyl-CoA C-acyltransferase [Labilithrix sp.]
MKDIVIVDAVRSAVGRAHKGSLAQKRPDELAAEVVRGLLARNPKIDKSALEDFVLGCAMPEGEQGLNVARVVELLGGLPIESSAQTINRFCASGLQAIATAAGAIALGSNDIVLAGGVESMSMVPMTGNKLSASPEAMEKAAAVYTPMGITAENVANKFKVSR